MIIVFKYNTVFFSLYFITSVCLTLGPRNFTVTSITSTSITLHWSPPSHGIVQSYRLTITGGGGPTTVPSTSTTHIFSSLAPFTQYMVTIAAVDSMGREGESTTATVTTILAGIYLIYYDVEAKMHKVL